MLSAQVDWARFNKFLQLLGAPNARVTSPGLILGNGHPTEAPPRQAGTKSFGLLILRQASVATRNTAQAVSLGRSHRTLMQVREAARDHGSVSVGAIHGRLLEPSVAIVTRIHEAAKEIKHLPLLLHSDHGPQLLR